MSRAGELFWNNDAGSAMKTYRRKVYGSKRWKATRLAVLAENPFCTVCAEQDKVVAAQDVDHIIPLSNIFNKGLNPELAYDILNLRGLCKRCHGKKSATEGLVKFNKNKQLKPL